MNIVVDYSFDLIPADGMVVKIGRKAFEPLLGPKVQVDFACRFSLGPIAAV